MLLRTSVAQAHEKGLTYSQILIEDTGITVSYITPREHILTRAPTEQDFFTGPFTDGFTIANNGKPCTSRLREIKQMDSIGSVNFQVLFTCPDTIDSLDFHYTLFFAQTPDHENIADFHLEAFKKQIIFTKEFTEFTVPVGSLREQIVEGPPQQTPSLPYFLLLGVKHILSGYDHILFLAALLLSLTGLRALVKTVTAFTLAHSITLTLATLDIFIIPSRWTEIIIAASIVYVAIENIRTATGKRRWMIAFLFGLFHGFGFSTVLKEMNLPRESLIPSVLLFNAGVEVGQLAILALIYPLLRAMRHIPRHHLIEKGLSLLIAFFGAYWLFQRLLL